MSASPGSREPLRVLFLGLPFGVSALMLRHCLENGRDIGGVIVPANAVPHLTGKQPSAIRRLRPADNSSLPLAGIGDSLDMLGVGWESGVPVWAISDLNDPALARLIIALKVDVAVVACFTRRIPASVLRVPRLGFLNYHPSLLPAYRGPVPLFWQLRDGAPTGVTIHWLDEGLDTGDLVAQTEVPFPDGCSGSQADRLLAQAGLRLIDDVLNDLTRGITFSQPQIGVGSYFSFPQPEDFCLSTAWTARQAFNFMRGTADWGRPYDLPIAGLRVSLSEAISFDPAGRLSRPFEREGDRVMINFTPGVLLARENRRS
jgi:methionyl-tRNA formyltransferase